ncbi:hypothetical protein B0H65DRAFT_459910 [Neurospora tetraspora]|uniref:Uncharacterized protein n=1 Tax=Neurospora tetraspora TaxID=94610 RepID=A0AAE0JM57_9PEZI|nr:hypothetical protein B0H65DRAFT_459910 [Neurospora tetraspora]
MESTSPIEIDYDLALRELELKWSFQKEVLAHEFAGSEDPIAWQAHFDSCIAKAQAGPPPESHDDKILKSQGLAQYMIKGPAVFHVEVDGDSLLTTGGLGCCTIHVIDSPRVMVDGLMNGRVLSKKNVYYDRSAEASSSKSTEGEASSSKSTDAGKSADANKSTDADKSTAASSSN